MELTFASPLSQEMNRSLRHGSFLACWQVQSKLAAISLLALVAISPWLALIVMMAWSLAATAVYYEARRRGVPDLLVNPTAPHRMAMRTGHIVGRVWLIGLSAYAFANILRPVLLRPSAIARGAVLGVGLTLFGVSTSMHMLQVAGFTGPRLLAISLVGAVMNVPYRIFCSALTLHLILEAFSLQLPTTYI